MAHGSSPLAVLEHSKYMEPFSLLHTGEGSLSKSGILAISILLKKSPAFPPLPVSQLIARLFCSEGRLAPLHTTKPQAAPHANGTWIGLGWLDHFGQP